LTIPGDATQSENRLLIFVHGHDFKPAAEEFMDLSVAALTAGIERDEPAMLDKFNAVEKKIAYYGDLTDALLASHGQRYDEILDVGDRRNALARLKSFDKKKHFGVARYDRLPGKNALGEFAADVVTPLASRLGLSRRLIDRVGTDVSAYFSRKSDYGKQVRERVSQTICEALSEERNIILISHGTGCIVTYDVLWQASHDPSFGEAFRYRKIDHWLTLGSPLGDSMVRKRLLGARRRGFERFPANVVSWHNISAEDDFVSHDNTLADDYKAMLRQRQVSCIRDYRIYNLTVRYGRSNPHSSIGYLIHPRTAQVICNWLRQNAGDALPTSIF